MIFAVMDGVSTVSPRDRPELVTRFGSDRVTFELYSVVARAFTATERARPPWDMDFGVNWAAAGADMAAPPRTAPSAHAPYFIWKFPLGCAASIIVSRRSLKKSYRLSNWDKGVS